jgi:hypothetical protein
MKFTVNIEATPEEARAFLGLPDIAPMQERLIKELEEKMADNIRTLDSETLAKTWMPMMMQSWSEMQKTFWGQMGMDTSSSKKED